MLFFPKNNEVLKQLQPYFETLDKGSDKFSVEIMDHALAPELTPADKDRRVRPGRRREK